WVHDYCEWSSITRDHSAHSIDGLFAFERSVFFSMPFGFQEGEIPAVTWINYSSWPRPIAGISLHIWEGGWTLIVSYFWAVVMTALVAAAPWTHVALRFSLRTLLIATTLVAIGLALIVYAVTG